MTLTRVLRGAIGGDEYFQITNLVTQYLIFWAIVIAVHVWQYHRRAQQRELRTSQLEALLAQTRLQMLSMQLQPHFLFNTLEHDRRARASAARGRGKNDRRPEPPVARDAPCRRRRSRAAGTRARRARPLHRDPARALRRSTACGRERGDRRRARRWCRACCCSRWSRTRSSTGSAPAPGQDISRLMPDEPAIACGSKFEMTAAGSATGSVKEGIGLGNCRSRLQALYGSGAFRARPGRTAAAAVRPSESRFRSRSAHDVARRDRRRRAARAGAVAPPGQAHDDVEIVAECGDGAAAVQAIEIGAARSGAARCADARARRLRGAACRSTWRRCRP